MTWLGWAANAVSGNGRTVRAIFVIGTAISVPMAASVSTAYDDGGRIFAFSLAGIVLLGLATLTLGAADELGQRLEHRGSIGGQERDALLVALREAGAEVEVASARVRLAAAKAAIATGGVIIDIMPK